MKQLTRRRMLGVLGAGGFAAAAPGIAGIRSADAAENRLAVMKSRLCGDVLLPGDEGYDAERAGWNLILEHHPKLIVVAGCERDVRWAVRYAAWAGLEVAVQATGHGVSVPADGAMLINTRRLDGVTVDAKSRSATVEAGAKWAPVLEAAGPHGLAPLVGSTPDVGVAGYVSGGGLPVLSRQFGVAVDHVRAINLVTMDGRPRRVSSAQHRDLFWAVRGGRGNFGVVTSVETDLMSLARLYGGGLFFAGSAAEQVLGTYLRWIATQPEKMSSSIAILNGAAPPEMAAAGDPVVHVRIAYTGSAKDGARLIRPLRELGPMQDTVAEMPYTAIGTIHNDPVEPAPSFVRSALVRELDDEAVRRMIELAGTGASVPPSLLELRHMGGSLARTPKRPSAIGHRDAAMMLFSAVHVPPSEAAAARKYQDRLMASIEPWDTGGVFPNFLGYADTTPERVRGAYEPADYLKLRLLKTMYDPRNLLRINFNIPPLFHH